jgi:membrane-associated phospholipid phosphatase
LIRVVVGKLSLALVVFLLASQAGAQQEYTAFAQRVSDSIVPYLAVGELAIFSDGRNGRNAAVQGLKALVVTDAATTILKATVREKRPHGQSRTSFPSRHASAAFAMATVISEYDSSWQIPAYGTAALIGWSRIETDSHYWWDVAAGAALGYFVARAFTKNNSSFRSNTVSCGVSW